MTKNGPFTGKNNPGNMKHLVLEGIAQMGIVHWLKGKRAAGSGNLPVLFVATIMASLCITSAFAGTYLPPPPRPEPVSIKELPVPPTAPSETVGSCTAAINPHGTGCLDPSPTALDGGSFLPGNHEVLASVNFTGAPSSGPSSIYSGAQEILVKTDGTTFSNGDPWKCLTCGVPAANEAGINPLTVGDYPQSFQDGMRILDSLDVLDCTPYKLASDKCTPNAMHIYPLRWNTSASGSGAGGSLRELRLHPDNVHLGFNTEGFSNGALTEWGMFGRLVFNPAPTTGLPSVPRYDIVNVTTLLPSNQVAQEVVTQVPGHPTELMINHAAISVGEFRGFSKDGSEAFYVGYPWQSDRIKVFAVKLATGAVREMTNAPGYVDPVDASPDDQWIVMDETMPSTRMQFMSAMYVPPITDMVTTGAVSSVRNNGLRRFFEPILLDRYGERGAYQGQQLNAGDARPGRVNDPNWNALADPRWSWDGTEVMYYQNLVVSPACGGTNPLPCPVSTEPGGRESRLMLAKLVSRRPYHYTPPAPVSDSVPWGTPYVPGSALPAHASLPAGAYTLAGQVSGSATIQLTDNAAQNALSEVSVNYRNFSDDGVTFLNGQESTTATYPNLLTVDVLWNSNLVQTGFNAGSVFSNSPQKQGFFVLNKKTTSPGGFDFSENLETNIFEATGTLDSLVGGVLYTQPGNGE